MRSIPYVLSFAGALVLACERKSEVEAPLTPAARTSPAAERAIGALAAARCDQQERCNAVGTNGPYGSRDACMNAMLSDGYRELGGCRLGVVQDELMDCVAEIQETACSESLASLEKIDGCSVDDLCAP